MPPTKKPTPRGKRTNPYKEKEQQIRWDKPATMYFKTAPAGMKTWEYAEQCEDQWIADQLGLHVRSVQKAVRTRADKRDAARDKLQTGHRNVRHKVTADDMAARLEAELAEEPEAEVAEEADAGEPEGDTAGETPPPAASGCSVARPLGMMGALLVPPHLRLVTAATESEVAPLAATIRREHPGGVPDKPWHMYEEDPVVWVKEKRVKINTKTKGLVQFEPWRWQETVMRSFWEGGIYFVEKSRQEGCSTCILVAACHALLFSLRVQGTPLMMPIVGDKEGTSKQLLKICKTVLTNARIDKDDRERLVGINPRRGNTLIEYIVDGNGEPDYDEDDDEDDGPRQGDNWIEAFTSTGSSARGFAFNAALLEEFAHNERAEAVWNSTRPVISDVPLARVWVVSTPNGASFHADLCDNAEDYGANYLPLDWRIRPERRANDDEWRKQKDREMGEELAAQEYDLKRVGAGDNLLDEGSLREFANAVPFLGKRPLPGHIYSKACDVAGPGRDKTVFTVVDVTPGLKPAQVVFQKELPKSANARGKKAFVEGLDADWPGILRVDGTNDSTFPETLSCRNKIAVRFRGEQQEMEKIDHAAGLRWEHLPREHMSSTFVTALETGSLVVHEKHFPELWESLRTMSYARKRQADGKLENAQKAKKRGKYPDYWDSAMMAAIPVRVIMRKERRNVTAKPRQGSAGPAQGPGGKLRDMQRDERASTRQSGTWRGKKW